MVMCWRICEGSCACGQRCALECHALLVHTHVQHDMTLSGDTGCLTLLSAATITLITTLHAAWLF